MPNAQRPIPMLGSPSRQMFQLRKPLNLDVNSCLLRETINHIRKSFALGLEDLRRNRESSYRIGKSFVLVLENLFLTQKN